MTDMVTIRGNVGTDIRLGTTKLGVPMATFRVATTDRYLDRETNTWMDRGSNWYTVMAFRSLAQNTACSISKGDSVIIVGRLRLVQWKNDDGRSGIAPEIDAETVGPDLVRGTVNIRRYAPQRPESTEQAEHLENSENTGNGMRPENNHGPENQMGDEPANGQGTGESEDGDAGDIPDDAAELTEDGEVVNAATGEISTAAQPY